MSLKRGLIAADTNGKRSKKGPVVYESEDDSIHLDDDEPPPLERVASPNAPGLRRLQELNAFAREFIIWLTADKARFLFSQKWWECIVESLPEPKSWHVTLTRQMRVADKIGHQSFVGVALRDWWTCAGSDKCWDLIWNQVSRPFMKKYLTFSDGRENDVRDRLMLESGALLDQFVEAKRTARQSQAQTRTSHIDLALKFLGVPLWVQVLGPGMHPDTPNKVAVITGSTFYKLRAEVWSVARDGTRTKLKPVLLTVKRDSCVFEGPLLSLPSLSPHKLDAFLAMKKKLAELMPFVLNGRIFGFSQKMSIFNGEVFKVKGALMFKIREPCEDEVGVEPFWFSQKWLDVQVESKKRLAARHELQTGLFSVDRRALLRVLDGAATLRQVMAENSADPGRWLS